jgi:hypothetical protein
MDGDGDGAELYQMQAETGRNVFTATQAGDEHWEVPFEIPMFVSGVTHASTAQDALQYATELPKTLKDLMQQDPVAELLGLQADTVSVRVLNRDQLYRAMELLQQYDDEAAAAAAEDQKEEIVQDAAAAGVVAAGGEQGPPVTPAAAVRRSASPGGLTAPSPAADAAVAAAAVEAPAASPRRSPRLQQQQEEAEAGQPGQLPGSADTRSPESKQSDSQQHAQEQEQEQQEGEGEHRSESFSGSLSAPSDDVATQQQLQAAAARKRRSEQLLHKNQFESALEQQEEEQQQQQEMLRRRRRTPWGLEPPMPDLPPEVLRSLPYILLGTWELSAADAQVQILADAAEKAAAAAAAGRISAAAVAAVQRREAAARVELAAVLDPLTEALQPYRNLGGQHRAEVERLMCIAYGDFGPTKQTINDCKKRQRLL